MDTGTLALSGNITDSGGTPGGLTKTGSGTLALSGTNTYSGTTTINAGTLLAGAANTFSATSATTINTGGTLDLGTFAQTINAVSLAGGTLWNGALTGAVTSTGGAVIGITGSASFTANGGTTTLTGSNGYSGTTVINNGATWLGGSANSFSANSAVLLATGGILNTGGFNQAIASLAGSGNVSLGAATLTAGSNNSSTTFSGVMSGSGGGFTKTGSGTFTLTNANTYTGLTTVSAGILALNTGAGLAGGVLNNATFTSAGTVSGALTNNATVNANGGAINGAVANNTNGLFNVGGTVTGNSTFANANGATLAIGAFGAYTLQGMLTNGGVVTVASGGTLNATAGGIANNAGGSITNNGTVHDDLNNAGSVTNNGIYVANVASNTGTVGNTAGSTWTGNVASNTGTLTNAGTWTGTIANSGSFTNATGGAVSGMLTNSAGTATNDGALNGGATVTGGILTGTGSVAGLNVAGGTFAPGNGTPGTSMVIAGSLAFQSGALYLVQVNRSASTLASVTGTATLAGTVGVQLSTRLLATTTYTILTSSARAGTFQSVMLSSGGLASNPRLSYVGGDVLLTLGPGLLTPLLVSPSANQQRVAAAIDNAVLAGGALPTGFNALFGLTGGNLNAALTQASGETAVGSQQTTFQAMTQFLGTLLDPFIDGRGNAPASTPGAAPYAEDSDASAYTSDGKPRSKRERDAYNAIYRKAPMKNTVYDPHWSVWAAGFGGSQTTDGNGPLGSNTATSRVFGTAVGADYLLSPRTIMGFALAGGGTNFSVANGGTGRSDLFQAGAFVKHTVGSAYISGALAYGWQDITTNRTVTIAGIDQLQARFNANAWSGRVEGGYRFVAPWIGGIGITPYAAGQFTTFDLPAYAESVLTGANTFALAYGARSVTDTRSELGIRTDKSFAMQSAVLTLRSRFAWAHDFNPDRSIGATFQALPGASFVVNGAAQASDSALTTASAEMKWINGWSAAATFEGEFSDVTRSYAGKGVARYAW